MQRFFITPEQAETARNGAVTLDGADAHHLAHVLRARKGDPVTLCATDGRLFLCRIESVSESGVLCTVEESLQQDTEPAVRVTLIQGIPKGEKMEWILQKAVELGVCSVRPAQTERTVVRFHSAADLERKQIRWQRIAEEAASQCGRGRIPAVGQPGPLEQIFEDLPEPSLRLIAYENEEQQTLRSVLEACRADRPQDIALLIGPEGGITPQEHALALRHGFRSVTLGKRILRTETAGIAALAAIRYAFED